MTTPMPAETGQEMTYWKHGWEKCKQQPMVPIGAAATTVALLGATASLRSGNRASFQKYLRLRVAAQGVTVLAMVIGAFYLGEKTVEARQVIPAPPVQPVVVDDETAQFYPPRVKTKVSDFTKRVRDSDEKKF